MKKYLAILLALLMLAAAFAGCGETKDPADPGTVTDPGTTTDPSGEEKPYGWFNSYFTGSANTVCRFFSTDTNPNLLSSLTTPWLYLDYVNEDGKTYSYFGDMAVDFPEQVDTEGKVWRVTLREGMTWANGDTLDANDVIYSVKMLLDPLLVNITANSITSNAYAKLVNAFAYQQQGISNTVKWEDVGIKLIDDLHFEITTEEPATQYKAMRFLCAISMVYEPLFEEYMSEDRSITTYGSSVESYMSGGRFALTEWIPDAKYVLTRNDKYWFRDRIHIEGITYTIVPNGQTAIELFMQGKLDTCTLTYTDWETFEDDPRVHEYYNDSLMYYFINMGNPNQNNLLGKLNFRKALHYGTDRVALAKTLLSQPVCRLVRKAVIGNAAKGLAFVDIPVDYLDDPTTTFSPAKANQYLDKALEECSLTAATMEIIQAETATSGKAANQFLQKQYNDTFTGKLSVSIRVVPSTITLRRWNPDDPTSFETAIGSLLPDATDPRATFKFYISSYSPPRFCYYKTEFDALYAESEPLDLDNDIDKIIELCQKMEKMLLDDLVSVPLYEFPTKVLFSERVQLPTEDFVVGWGFGEQYCRIVEKAN